MEKVIPNSFTVEEEIYAVKMGLVATKKAAMAVVLNPELKDVEFTVSSLARTPNGKYYKFELDVANNSPQTMGFYRLTEDEFLDSCTRDRSDFDQKITDQLNG
jgi:hypothetical protein